MRSALTPNLALEPTSYGRFGRIERIFELGLRNYLEEFRDSIFDLGCRISDDFLIPASA